MSVNCSTTWYLQHNSIIYPKNIQAASKCDSSAVILRGELNTRGYGYYKIEILENIKDYKFIKIKNEEIVFLKDKSNLCEDSIISIKEDKDEYIIDYLAKNSENTIELRIMKYHHANPIGKSFFVLIDIVTFPLQIVAGGVIFILALFIPGLGLFR